jgi:hypothetical protein
MHFKRILRPEALKDYLWFEIGLLLIEMLEAWIRNACILQFDRDYYVLAQFF